MEVNVPVMMVTMRDLLTIRIVLNVIYNVQHVPVQTRMNAKHVLLHLIEYMIVALFHAYVRIVSSKMPLDYVRLVI